MIDRHARVTRVTRAFSRVRAVVLAHNEPRPPRNALDRVCYFVQHELYSEITPRDLYVVAHYIRAARRREQERQMDDAHERRSAEVAALSSLDEATIRAFGARYGRTYPLAAAAFWRTVHQERIDCAGIGAAGQAASRRYLAEHA